MPDEAKELFQDILDAVVCEDAGTNDPFMYIWTDKWKSLKKRIKDYLKQSSESKSNEPSY